MFTALDLFQYSASGMLSDFWHTFCREDLRSDRTMARAKTPFLFVQIFDVRRKKNTAEREIARVDVARHISVVKGYLF